MGPQDTEAAGGGAGRGIEVMNDTTKIRILIADDSALYRDCLRDMLEDFGFQVVGDAGDGRQALDMARTLRPDVVLMDLHLPLLSGHEATAAIVRELPRVRVVGPSLYADGPVTELLQRSGAAAYVQKDEPVDDLVEVIRRVAAEAS